MPRTYEPIATTTLGSAVATVDFTGISSNYTDLLLVMNLTAASTAFDVQIQFNGDTGSNYSQTILYGNGSSAVSTRLSSQTQIKVDTQAAVRSTSRTVERVNVMNYANTTTNKTVLMRADNAGDATETAVGLWSDTSAINRIYITNTAAANFAIGCVFTIYGITAA